MIKLSLHHKQDDSEKKRPSSRRFPVNLKNIGSTFFMIIQIQSVSVLSDLCPSMLFFPFAVFFWCSSTAGYCNVSFYVLGFLGVTKLCHFAWHSLFKFYGKRDHTRANITIRSPQVTSWTVKLECALWWNRSFEKRIFAIYLSIPILSRCPQRSFKTYVLLRN